MQVVYLLVRRAYYLRPLGVKLSLLQRSTVVRHEVANGVNACLHQRKKPRVQVSWVHLWLPGFHPDISLLVFHESVFHVEVDGASRQLTQGAGKGDSLPHLHCHDLRLASFTFSVDFQIQYHFDALHVNAIHLAGGLVIGESGLVTVFPVPHIRNVPEFRDFGNGGGMRGQFLKVHGESTLFQVLLDAH